MPNIVFTLGGNSFQFSKGRVFPIDDPASVTVPVDYSAGGQLYAYDKGIEEQLFNLVFDGLGQTDYDNVENWLLNVAVGPKNPFTYTDEAGTDHTVRQLDTVNPLRQTRANLYVGTIRLRKEI